MNIKSTIVATLAMLSFATTSYAHDGAHTYTNGICTIDGCTDKYQPAELSGGGIFN